MVILEPLEHLVSVVHLDSLVILGYPGRADRRERAGHLGTRAIAGYLDLAVHQGSLEQVARLDTLVLLVSAVRLVILARAAPLDIPEHQASRVYLASAVLQDSLVLLGLQVRQEQAVRPEPAERLVILELAGHPVSQEFLASLERAVRLVTQGLPGFPDSREHQGLAGRAVSPEHRVSAAIAVPAERLDIQANLEFRHSAVHLAIRVLLASPERPASAGRADRLALQGQAVRLDILVHQDLAGSVDLAGPAGHLVQAVHLEFLDILVSLEPAGSQVHLDIPGLAGHPAQVERLASLVILAIAVSLEQAAFLEPRGVLVSADILVHLEQAVRRDIPAFQASPEQVGHQAIPGLLDSQASAVRQGSQEFLALAEYQGRAEHRVRLAYQAILALAVHLERVVNLERAEHPVIRAHQASAGSLERQDSLVIAG